MSLPSLGVIYPMLFKLSLKNIKKSIKDYAIYFFTLILGVAIFYVFNAIESQTVMLQVSKSTHELIKLMNTMLSGVSVFVSFILGFLIIYASRFLIKRRKKEFGIYMTLGMSKGKISKILLFETLLIGIISLIVGLGLGVILSQLMSIIVANMFEADMTKFAFTFSSSAVGKTILYFGIIYLLVMIFNTFSVSKCKLINLINANRKNEKIKVKNPVICTLIFIISVGLLGYAYYNVTALVNSLTQSKLILMIIFGCIGTFLLFWSLSGLILRIVKSIKKIYLKGLNCFVLKQIDSKVNTTVFSMTIICLMLFLTISILSSGLSLKNSMTSNLKELAPVDIELYKPLDISGNDIYGVPYSNEVIEDSKTSVKDTLDRMNFDYNKNFKDMIDFNSYATNELTVRNTLGNYLSEVENAFPALNLDTAEEIVKISDYNKVAKLYGNKTYELDDDEYMIIADFDSMIEIRNKSLSDNTNITLLGKTYSPKYSECKDGFISMSSNHINTGIILVPDDAVDESIRARNHLIANYNANDEEGRKNIENQLTSDELGDIVNTTLLEASSKISIYEASIGLSALITFIGIYLGIIFLISSAAILALKELSESSDNKERYTILRKIGVDEKMINKSLFVQIAIFFLLPLFIAIIHSIFGLMFANEILITFGNEHLLTSIIVTACILIFIYGGYFIITYLCSKNIIKS